MSVVRWSLVDPVTGERWTLPVNPNTASSPLPGRKNISTAQGANLDAGGIHRTRVFQAPSAPTEWEFGGVVLSKAQHDALAKWSEKSNEVRVSDHLGRTFEVIIRQLEVVDRRPLAGRTKYRMTYTMRALVLRRMA